jgi:hypothetical protein
VFFFLSRVLLLSLLLPRHARCNPIGNLLGVGVQEAIARLGQVTDLRVQRLARARPNDTIGTPVTERFGRSGRHRLTGLGILGPG